MRSAPPVRRAALQVLQRLEALSEHTVAALVLCARHAPQLAPELLRLVESSTERRSVDLSTSLSFVATIAIECAAPTGAAATGAVDEESRAKVPPPEAEADLWSPCVEMLRRLARGRREEVVGALRRLQARLAERAEAGAAGSASGGGARGRERLHPAALLVAAVEQEQFDL